MLRDLENHELKRWWLKKKNSFRARFRSHEGFIYLLRARRTTATAEEWVVRRFEVTNTKVFSKSGVFPVGLPGSGGGRGRADQLGRGGCRLAVGNDELCEL